MPPALEVEALPHIDAVLISHNHYDHLDTATVKRLARQAGGAPRFFVPLGLRAWFAAKGIDHVIELDWWDRQAFGPLAMTCTPVQHWSARGTFDRNRTLWCGWRVDAPRFSFFFAGDTGYSPDFVDIHRRLGPVMKAVSGRRRMRSNFRQLAIDIQNCGLQVRSGMAGGAILLVRAAQQANRAGSVMRHVATVASILRDRTIPADIRGV